MADELISRQALVKALGEQMDRCPLSYLWGLDKAMTTLNKLPAGGAVEVVRCGECIHRHEEIRPNCHGRRPDWFCADGVKRPGTERREENAAD